MSNAIPIEPPERDYILEQAAPISDGEGVICAISVEVHPVSADPNKPYATAVSHIITLAAGEDGLGVTIEPPLEPMSDGAKKHRLAILRSKSQRAKYAASLDNYVPHETVSQLTLHPGDDWEMVSGKAIKMGEFTFGTMLGQAKVKRIPLESGYAKVISLEDSELVEYQNDDEFLVPIGEGSDFIRITKLESSEDEVELSYVHQGIVYVRTRTTLNAMKEHKKATAVVAAGVVVGLGSAAAAYIKHKIAAKKK